MLYITKPLKWQIPRDGLRKVLHSSERAPSPSGTEERTAAIATECDEMGIAASLVAPKRIAHGSLNTRNSQPPTLANEAVKKPGDTGIPACACLLTPTNSASARPLIDARSHLFGVSKHAQAGMPVSPGFFTEIGRAHV